MGLDSRTCVLRVGRWACDSATTGAGIAIAVSVAAHATAAADVWLLGYMRLVMLREMGFLSEALAAEGAGEWFLTGVCPDVDVHAVLILEAFATDAAVVERTLLALLHAAW